jgi:hypothetical protein
MRRFALFFVIWSLAIFAVHSQTTRPPSRPLPRLAGVILDTNKKPIAYAQVQLTGKNGQFKSETKVDGSYSLQLPGGEYSLAIMAKGFCAHAQNLSIASDEMSLSKDFALIECSDCPPMIVDFNPPNIGLDGTPPDLPDFLKLPSMKYQVDDLRGHAASPKSKQSMLFGRRDESGDTVEFVGLFCPGYDKLPVFTFDGGNIKADKFIYSKESHILRGEGNVVLVDERGISRGRLAEIQLAQETARVLSVK